MKLKLNRKSDLLTCIYQRPNECLNILNEKLLNYLEQSGEIDVCIIVRNTNINILSGKNTYWVA